MFFNKTPNKTKIGEYEMFFNKTHNKKHTYRHATLTREALARRIHVLSTIIVNLESVVTMSAEELASIADADTLITIAAAKTAYQNSAETLKELMEEALIRERTSLTP